MLALGEAFTESLPQFRMLAKGPYQNDVITGEGGRGLANDDEAHFIRETLQRKVMTKLGGGGRGLRLPKS